jgi:hypothetical protein
MRQEINFDNIRQTSEGWLARRGNVIILTHTEANAICFLEGEEVPHTRKWIWKSNE